MLAEGETVDTEQSADQLQSESISAAQDFHGIKKRNTREEFDKIVSDPQFFADLCNNCLQGNHPTGFSSRWTAWRILLGLIPLESEERMREEVKKSRDYFESEYNKYMKIRPEDKLEADIDNPLSKNEKNPWNNYYADTEIKEKIVLDTKRTYQEIPFFTLKSSQDLLLDILFVWSKQNPDLCYRQGMNEIVAVIAYVCYTENFNPENPNEDLFGYLNDENYATADIYAVFNKIMQLNHKEMFIFGQSDKTKKQKKPNPDALSRPNLPIVRRATEIQEKLLPRLNETLSQHLQSLEVDPHIYMIKWIRCMLSREFELEQVLRLWDCIFAYRYYYAPTSEKLDMLDYFCASMILSIADELLQRDDESIILGRLVKYPEVEDVTNIIRMSHYGVLYKLRSQDKQETESGEGEAPNEEIDKDENLSPSPGAGKLEEEYKNDKNQKGIFLFNATMPLLKNKPNKEQAVAKHHENLKQGITITPIVDPLTTQAPKVSSPQPKETSPTPASATDNKPKQENKETNRFAHYLLNKISIGKKEESVASPTQELKTEKERAEHKANEFNALVRKGSEDRDLDEENILKIETAIQLIQVENERLNSEIIQKALSDLSSAFSSLRKKHLDLLK